MQPAVSSVEAQRAKRHLSQFLDNFGEIAITHLFQVAKSGGLNGKSPKANITAMLVQGETGDDFSELSEDEAREAIANFFRKNRHLHPPSVDQEKIEEYFADIQPEHRADSDPKCELVAECCQESLERGI